MQLDTLAKHISTTSRRVIEINIREPYTYERQEARKGLHLRGE